MSKGEADYLHWSATSPTATPEALEDFVSMQRGARRVAFTNILDNHVLDRVKLMDSRRNGVTMSTAQARAKEKKRMESNARAHEKARAAADVVSHLVRRQGSAMSHGHTDEILRAAMRLPPTPKVKPTVSVPKLVDAHGAVIGAAPKETKIHLATR